MANAYSSQFQAIWLRLKNREKILVTFSLSVALAGGLDTLITVPLSKKIMAEQTQAKTLKLEIKTQQQEALSVAQKSVAEKKKKEQLLRRLNKAQVALTAMRKDAEQAIRLPEVLKGVVNSFGHAQLQQMTFEGASDPVSNANGEIFYRLPVEMKLVGSWEDLVNLMKVLQKEAASLQWSTIELNATNWPKIELDYRGHVLSHHHYWGIPDDNSPITIVDTAEAALEKKELARKEAEQKAALKKDNDAENADSKNLTKDSNNEKAAQIKQQ